MKNDIIMTLALISLLSCNLDGEPAPFPYDSTINDKRREVGLRLIDSTFNPFLNGSTYDKVNNIFYGKILKPKKNNGVDTLKSPTYWSKHIHLDKKTGELLAEDDVFRSGKYKSDADMTYFESLILRYLFQDDFDYLFNTNTSSKNQNSKERFSKGWYYIYRFPKFVTEDSKYHKKFYKYETRMLVNKEADSILKSWKLKR